MQLLLFVCMTDIVTEQLNNKHAVLVKLVCFWAVVGFLFHRLGNSIRQVIL